MALRGNMLVVVFVMVLGCSFVGGLEINFYRDRCPSAELIVNQEIKRSMLNDPSTGAALVRLAFHDCQGCDGSVLLRDSESLTTETLSDMNFGIRKLEIIDEIKTSLETICPQTVSCADIIQLAAREAILSTGGPYIEVLTGRRDSISTSKDRADKQLPAADISIDEFIEIFRQKNISLEDAVALIGAHTLGIGHCRSFENRLWDPMEDPTLSPSFTAMLQVICSNPSLSDIAFATNDATTFAFDNSYFLDVLNGRGLLKIDSEISRDLRTLQYVVGFARNQQWFFNRFSAGFMKLSSYKVLTGEEGEIRRECRFINN
ncbi:peroxidase 29-like [Cornus florida]|uniref:peroxidase 29-like n=1 Tax=Cornus florida TaxID=4283 RepID=UPI00289FE131|nr:peroxidase 29-like [Cornus florida]